MEVIIDKIEYVPENCLLELCFKCNLNCKHCGSSINAFSKKRQGRELKKDEVIKIIRELKELGGKKIGLVGGEPLLCDYWEDIASYANRLNFELSMISNGMLIDQEVADRIKKSGIKLVALSLDGPRDFHNELRGNIHAFDQVLKAAEFLSKAGVQVNIITTIMNKNINHLEEIEKIIEKLNISFWQLQMGIPMGKLKNNSDLVLHPNRMAEVEQFILECQKRNRIELTVADSIGYCSKNEILLRNNSSTDGTRAFLGCMAGCRVVAVESNGNVKGCLSLQHDSFIEGNVLEKPLTQIWQDTESFKYNRKFKIENLGGECALCDYGPVCRGGCTALAYNASGYINNNPYCISLYKNN